MITSKGSTLCKFDIMLFYECSIVICEWNVLGMLSNIGRIYMSNQVDLIS